MPLIALAFFIHTTSLGLAVALGLVWFLILLIERKRLFLIRLGYLFLFMGIFQTVKFEYRKTIPLMSKDTFARRTQVLFMIVSKRFLLKRATASTEPNPPAVLETPSSPMGQFFFSFRRLGDPSLGRVLTWTPEKVPYWEGRTYTSLGTFGMFWNSDQTMWNEFGKTYGFLSTDDHSTTVAFSYLAEAYMNFGFTVLLIAALLFGAFTFFAERLAFRLGRGYTTLASISLISPLAYSQDAMTIISGLIAIAIVLMALSAFQLFGRQT